MSMVLPARRVSRSRSSSTSSPVSRSRLPVGSSARTSAGSAARARATATRCCSPPESRSGNCPPRSARPTSSRSAERPLAIRAARPPGELERQQEVLLDGEGRDEVEELEDEADAIAPRHRALVLGEAPELPPLEEHLAGGRQVDPGDEVQQRRLPRAAAPQEHHQLPRRDGARDPVEHDALAARFEEAPLDGAQLDDGSRSAHRPTLRQLG